MGCDHEKRTYAKKSDNTGDIDIGFFCTASSKKPVEHIGVSQQDYLHEAASSIRSVEGSNQLLEQDGMCYVSWSDVGYISLSDRSHNTDATVATYLQDFALVDQQVAQSGSYYSSKANADINTHYSDSSISTAYPPIMTARTGILSDPRYPTAADDTMNVAMAPRLGLPSEQKTFTCPKCNSGHGRYVNNYTTQSQKHKRALMSSSHKSSISVDPPKVEIRAQYVTKKAFKNHLETCHIHDFKKPLSVVYECCYCPCDGIGSFIRCNAEHNSEEDLMNHVAECHAKGWKSLVKEKHVCEAFFVVG
jgi:hypothetical protein